MIKKLKHTTNAVIRSFIRLLWMKSPERARVLQRDKYTCQNCGVKQSKAKGKEVKVEVHHCNGINWEGIAERIRREVIEAEQITLCKECHTTLTKIERGI